MNTFCTKAHIAVCDFRKGFFIQNKKWAVKNCVFCCVTESDLDPEEVITSKTKLYNNIITKPHRATRVLHQNVLVFF